MSADSGGHRPPGAFNIHNVVHRGEMPTPAESTDRKFKSHGHAYFTHPSDNEKYFIISGESIRGFDVFDIQEALEKISKDKFKRVNRLQSGDILVQTRSSQQITALKSTSCFGSDNNPVSVSENGVLNQCQGIIRCREIMKLEESRICDKLKDQNVIAVHRMKRRENGRWIDTATHILTFKSPVCPREVDVGYLTVPTEIFIPSPFRCNICQKIGHTKKRCNSEKNQPTCGICGQHEVPHPFHLPCFLPRCVNCGAQHPSYSKNCQRYIDEKEINTIRVTMRIPYNLAREELAKRRASISSRSEPSKDTPSASSYAQVLTALPIIKAKSNRKVNSPFKSTNSVNRSQDFSKVSKVTNKAFKRQITKDQINTTIQALVDQSNTSNITNAQLTSDGLKHVPSVLTNLAQNQNQITSPKIQKSHHATGLESTTQPPFSPLFPLTHPSPFSLTRPPPDPDPRPPDLEISDIESNSSDIEMNQNKAVLD